METVNLINSYVRAVVAWIGHTSVLGITLDIPAHLFAAAVIYYLLAARGVRTLYCILVVALAELMKELYDLSALLHHGDYLEPLKDLFFTALGAWLGHFFSRKVEIPDEIPAQK